MLVVVVVLCKVVRVTGHGYQVPVGRGYPEGIDFARTSPRRDMLRVVLSWMGSSQYMPVGNSVVE